LQAQAAQARLPQQPALTRGTAIMLDPNDFGSMRERHPQGLTAKLYAMMTGVALLTFAILVAGYELLPSEQPFA
jgi:hypothetical protein